MVENYKLHIKHSAEKEIAALTRTHRVRVVEAIRKLVHDQKPPGCEKLSRQGSYRIRVGVYRIVYCIQDDRLIVEVVKVGHRREVYR